MTSPGSGSLPYSQACENNKGYILEHLTQLFSDRKEVLELGGGTGQHATCFAAGMPWLRWKPTDVPANLANLKLRCDTFAGDNLLATEALDVAVLPWTIVVPDAVFTANSLHIMPFTAVKSLFSGLGAVAARGTLLVVYGPFNYGGKYTSPSNAGFDLWLQQQHPLSAIRHFEKVDSLAADVGFELEHDFEMPANNRLLVWRKSIV